MLDYYKDSMMGGCKLVKTQGGDTILYKNNQEYTSPLQKVLSIDKSKTATGNDILAISENSIYMVHSNILGKTP